MRGLIIWLSLNNVTMEIEIKGHSGCQVEIVNKGGNLYISKSTHNKDYVSRLYRQAVKQQDGIKGCLSAYTNTRDLRNRKNGGICQRQDGICL